MSQGERVAGTPDKHCDQISALRQELPGGETCHQRIEDAGPAGDDELAGFLAQVRAEERHRAESTRPLLVGRLQLAVR